MSEDDADGVGRFFNAGQNRGNGAFRECSVTHFAAAYAGHAARLAHAEGRKVVVEHEVFLLLAFVGLQALAVVGGAQRGRDQCLRLAACKERRTVSARQHARFNGDRANLIECTAIWPNAILGDLLTEDPLAQMLVVGSQLLFGGRIVRRAVRQPTRP